MDHNAPQPLREGDAEALFAEFLELERAGQAPELEQLCERHPEQAEELRQRHRQWRKAGAALERLRQTGAELGASSGDEVEEDPEARARAELLWGRYKVQGEVGRGGMGSILSVRDEGLGRELAMKVMRSRSALALLEGAYFEDPARLARFEEEARITGRLEHPGIVPVHELGQDPQGRPYFTMKLVGGRTFRSILKLVREEREGWNVQRALGVLLKVCEAVGFAHDKGVVHRDLKPANLMIGSFGEVYVMDWGLARDLRRSDLPASPSGGESADSGDVPTDHVTQEGDVLGTLEYMSPEQASGKRELVGPPTDVFAVGAMLYELLCGEPPLGVRPNSSPHVRLAAALGREVEPVRTRAPETLAELCSITEKALSPEPDQRYASMVELAEDLRAYLEGRVVQAHATGAWQEAKKWVQRNKAVASLAASLLLAVTVSLVVVSVLAVEISDQKTDIERQKGDLEDAYASLELKEQEARENLLLADMHLQQANHRTGQLEHVARFHDRMLVDVDIELMGVDLISRQRAELAAILDRDGVAESEAEELVAAFDELMIRLNSTDLARGVLDDNILRYAVGTIDSEYTGRPELESILRMSVGNSYYELGLLDKALPQLERCLELCRELYGDAHVQTLLSRSRLGSLQEARGEFQLALENQTLAWSGLVELGEEAAEFANAALTERGNALVEVARYEEALEVFEQAYDEAEAMFGLEDLRTLRLLGFIGDSLRSLGRLDAAEAPLVQALRVRQRLLGERDLETLSAHWSLSTLYRELGRFDESEEHLRVTYEGRREQLGDDHPRTISALSTLASLVLDQGRLEEAEPLHRESVERARRVLGADHPRTLTALSDHALLLESLGHRERAFELAKEALDGRLRTLGDRHLATLSSMVNVGQWHASGGELEEAEALYRRAYEGMLASLGEEHTQTLIVMNNLASLYSSQERFEESLELHERVYAVRKEHSGPDHPLTLNSLNNLGTLMQRMGRYEDSLKYLQEALEKLQARYGAHPKTLTPLWNVAAILELLERPEEAEPYWAEAVRIMRDAVPPESPVLLEYLRSHGECLHILGRHAEAEALYLEDIRILEGLVDHDPEQLRLSVEFLCLLYEAWHAVEPDGGYDAKAATWREKL